MRIKSDKYPLLTLSITIAMLATSATQSFAAEDAIDEIIVEGHYLEETVPSELAKYGNQLEVVTYEELKERGYVDVSQALQMTVPGLHITTEGPFDYVDASLQGSRGNEILWLVDGVRINNRLYSSTSPLDTLPVHMVERIEVLKGGQGIFYGTQSIGGVINIVTKGFENNTDGAISAGISSNDGYHTNAYVRGMVGTHQYVVYGSKDEAQGYQQFLDEDFQPSATDRERGYDVRTVGAKYAWKTAGNSRLSLQVHQTDAELDFARINLNRFTVNERTEQLFTAKYDFAVNDHIEFFIKAYQHNWDTEYTRIYNQLDDNGNLTGTAQVINDASYWGYEDYGFNAIAKFRTQHGLEYVLGFDQQNFSGADEVWRIADQEEQVNAPFVQIRTNENLFESAYFALGFRNNRPSTSKDVTVWNFTGRYTFSDRFYIQANLGTSFRLPDAEELYLNEIYDENNDGFPDGYFSVGNPNLEPEESQNINVSVGGTFKRASFIATAFSRDITNYIGSYLPTSIQGVAGDSFFNTEDEVKINGIEVTTSFAINDQLDLSITHTHTRARETGSDTQISDIPEDESKIGLNYEFRSAPAGLTLSANVLGDINDRYGLARGNYALIDLAGHLYFGENERHQITARSENLTNKNYVTGYGRTSSDHGETITYGFRGMPRSFHLSYIYQF